MGTLREIRYELHQMKARDFAPLVWPPTFVRFLRWRRNRHR